MSIRSLLGILGLGLSLSLPALNLDARLSAQETEGRWIATFHVAGLGTRAENDRWYVTEEGYHVHPYSDGFAPGFDIGLAYQLSAHLRLGTNLLYGRAPLTLGMIDQNSDREPETEEPMGFLGILLRPSLNLHGGENWSFVVGPTLGLGWMQEVPVEPPFGPTVTFGGSTDLILGWVAGVDVRLGDSPFHFSGRALGLNLTLPLHEDGLGQEMSKSFGPMGLLAGISYRKGP